MEKITSVTGTETHDEVFTSYWTQLFVAIGMLQEEKEATAEQLESLDVIERLYVKYNGRFEYATEKTGYSFDLENGLCFRNDEYIPANTEVIVEVPNF